VSERLQTVLALADENPAEPMAQYMAGNELLNAGLPARAIEYLTRYVSMRAGADLGAAYRLIGRAHAELGQREAAREAFQAGIESALAHGHSDLAQAIGDELESL
jgi:predicted Zn-dependent protease